ncbi:MAG: hypothetical protein PHR06_02515 [Candidatus Cloacimonetes bacterium]|nr:hypothetical protein [Candidatus Cloacimonadota bacterium]
MQEINNNSVRHDYPVSIRNASFGTALGLMMKTLPYALARLGILVGITIVTIIWGVITFGGASLLSAKVHGIAGFIWIGVGCSAYGYIWYMIVRYALYMLKCGHIAVLTELITHGKIQNTNENMFAYGKRVVKDRFTQVNVLFGMDVLIDGIVKSFNRTLDWITGIIPIPGLEKMMSVVKAILFSSATYIDETIFSYILAKEEKNPWKGGVEGLIYYCQNSKEILKSALWIVILDKALTVVLWMIMLIPAFGVVYVTGGNTGFWAIVIAVLFAANIRSAILKPLFLIMIMSKFHVVIENQPINTEWEGRLNSISDKFRELKRKATDWMSSGKKTSSKDSPEPDENSISKTTE